MTRIALANTQLEQSCGEAVRVAVDCIRDAGEKNADVICFPECFVPGYRFTTDTETLTVAELEEAWSAIDSAAAAAEVAVILGTERIVDAELRITARVTNADGSLAGFQDKVQLDPSEEEIYSPGHERRIFKHGDLTFGIVICHEGWRYPETVRWAARHGAQVVFHPHTEIVEHPEYRPTGFADPDNTFHEKAALCRAAENHCFFATVNNAIPGATTTSAVIGPEGSRIAHQPYGEHGLLVVDIDPTRATNYLAKRLRPSAEP